MNHQKVKEQMNLQLRKENVLGKFHHESYTSLSNEFNNEKHSLDIRITKEVHVSFAYGSDFLGLKIYIQPDLVFPVPSIPAIKKISSLSKDKSIRST